MKRKAVACLLAAVMTMGMLAGCGGSDSGSTSDSSTDSGDTAEESSDDGTTVTELGEYTEENPYHLVFAFIEFATQDDTARDAVEQAVNDYMIPNYHIEVEFLPLQYATYANDIQLAISGGDELDVIPIFYSYASSWIAMNGIVDMNQYMDSEEGQAIIDVLGEANAYVGTMNDVLFGFPAQKESVDIGGLVMRKDICDELGITEEYGLTDNNDEYDGTIYDWSEATKIFEKVHEAYPDMTVMYLGQSTNISTRMHYFDQLTDSMGVLDWATDHTSTTVINEFESDAYKEIMTLVAEWYDAGYIYKDAATDTQGSGTMMKAGNTFCYPQNIKPGYLTEAKAANGCDSYALFFGEFPEGAWATYNVSFFDTGIATNSADPEMAFKFIAALYTDATLYNLWQDGIEGTNYQVLDDGTAYYVDGEDATSYKYHQNSGWAMGNQFQGYVWNDGTKDADYWDKLQEFNSWASYSPAYGFAWDSSEFTTQYTAVSNVINQYRPAIETGSVGVANLESTLEEFNEALYAAGLQDIIDEKQRQLDEWLAENGATETPAENLEKIATAQQ